MTGRLDNKVIVIVGGTTGLGAAAARACVAAGARVVLVGRSPESVRAMEAELGSGCRGVTADARDPATAPAAIALACESFGRADALYHVAGGSGRRLGDGPLHEVSDAGWTETLAWNLDSAAYSNRAALRHWLDSGTAGVILNVGSVLASHAAPKYFATHAYAAAKAALEGMTTSTAAYYAPHNIRINAILPGLVDTPMAQRAVQDPHIVDYVSHRQALDGGRVGWPTDLDGAVVFLLSDEARFITGQVLAVDGGWSVRDG